MAIKLYKPSSNGRRNMSVSTFSEITADTPEKTLLRPRLCSGRSNVFSGVSAVISLKVDTDMLRLPLDDGLYSLIAIAFPSLRLIFSFQRSPVLYCLLKVRQWLFYDWDGIHRSGPSV